MSPEQRELETLRAQLQEATVRVPHEVQNGSIQLTRAWLKAQKQAVKILNKRTAKAHELKTALNALAQGARPTWQSGSESVISPVTM